MATASILTFISYNGYLSNHPTTGPSIEEKQEMETCSSSTGDGDFNSKQCNKLYNDSSDEKFGSSDSKLSVGESN